MKKDRCRYCGEMYNPREEFDAFLIIKNLYHYKVDEKKSIRPTQFYNRLCPECSVKLQQTLNEIKKEKSKK